MKRISDAAHRRMPERIIRIMRYTDGGDGAFLPQVYPSMKAVKAAFPKLRWRYERLKKPGPIEDGYYAEDKDAAYFAILSAPLATWEDRKVPAVPMGRSE
jgi:hypothetical protein